MSTSDQTIAAAAAMDTKPSRAKSLRREKNPPAHAVKRNAKSARHAKASSAKKAQPPRRGSKTAKLLALLQRPGGASLSQLQKASGWQAHSVRGFLSGALKKKMGLRLDSARLPDGQRTYRVASK